MAYDLPPHLLTLLSTPLTPNRRTVIMTCGISGSGKSTLSKSLVAQYPDFVRLSIDNYVHQHRGAFGVDFPAEKNEEYQEEAVQGLEKEFKKLLREGKRDVVLDFSFYDREYRDEWREFIDEVYGNGERSGNGEGGVRPRVVIVYFEAEEEVLWRRIEERRAGVRDADRYVFSHLQQALFCEKDARSCFGSVL
jgi:predicted kinase